jgi:hypothetical protein
MTSRATVTRVLRDDFRMGKQTRRPAQHDSTKAQKVGRAALWHFFGVLAPENTKFKGLVRRDESWACHGYAEASVNASSREEVPLW